MRAFTRLPRSLKPSKGLLKPGFRSFSHVPVTVLTEEEEMFKDTVAKFAQERVQPLVAEMDKTSVMDKSLIKDMFDNGLMGVEIDADHGGAGASFMSAIVTIEELAKVDPSVSVCADVHNTLVNNVFRFWGSEELNNKYLPQLATEKLGSFCLSESGSGSDAFALKTKAEQNKDGDWVINGSKLWITNSGEADVFLVFANIDHDKGYKGISCFVAERGFDGLEIGKKEDKLGIRASSTCPITFTDVVIPKENVLGELGKGYKYAIEILNEGRIGIGGQMVGLAQGTFDLTMKYLGERQQFGQPIGKFQGMEFQYAQAATEIEAARLLVYNAARMKEQGQVFVKEAAMAKYYSSEVASRVSRKCVEWMGGVGFTKDMPQEKFYRDNVIGSIYEGTSNIQLQTIAKLLQKEHW